MNLSLAIQRGRLTQPVSSAGPGTGTDTKALAGRTSASDILSLEAVCARKSRLRHKALELVDAALRALEARVLGSFSR